MSGRVEIGPNPPAGVGPMTIWGETSGHSPWDVDALTWRIFEVDCGVGQWRPARTPSERRAVYAARQRVRRAAVDIWLAERFR